MLEEILIEEQKPKLNTHIASNNKAELLIVC